ncbi:unnamed protein product [Litomosoides sigmodontis]|uniref:Uncharacterized protein n=1 Tax=Litomosoides sigmodontis TaxID=42156 RepID=A0A3P6U9X9_LITSI|nr:unnamed protein product [Litomosoides sigmodontis]
MANAYDTNDKFMVTMSADTLQAVCNRMEDDDPEADDDKPVSFAVWNSQVAPFTSDLLDDALHSAEVVNISTPSASQSGMSEYLMIMPSNRRRAHTFSGKRLSSSSASSSESHRSE